MRPRFNKPPGWPTPPDGWEPSANWAPDPSWPPAPAGWPLWITDAEPHSESHPGPQFGRPLTVSAPPTVPTLDLSATMTTPGGLPGASSTSLANTVFGIGSPAHARPRLNPRATLARTAGWGTLGVVVLVAAAITVGDLTGQPAGPAVKSAGTAPQAPAASPTEPPSRSGTAESATDTEAAEESSTKNADDPIEQAIARAASGTPLHALAELDVRRRGPSIGYARARFGSALTDTDGNGCDQRNDVLRRDLTGQTLQDGSNGCTVLSGTLADPYTGRTLTYLRAVGGRVRIDHVVSLGDAWRKGAQDWTSARRSEFATDPLNLLAVSAEVIADKQGADATSWLPAAVGYQCAYVARQVAVKHKYRIWVTPAERTAMADRLTRCDQLELPTTTTIALGAGPR